MSNVGGGYLSHFPLVQFLTDWWILYSFLVSLSCTNVNILNTENDNKLSYINVSYLITHINLNVG